MPAADANARAKTRLVLADDDLNFRRVVQFQLEEKGYEVILARDGREALEIIGRERPVLLITDVQMPGMGGLDLIAKVREGSEIPIVVITAFGSIEIAVEAMKRGADDFITKPFNREELLATVDKALKMGRLQDENRYLKAQLKQTFDPALIVGSSPPIQQVIATAEKLTRSDVGVLIVGESGTGKEVIAKTIHFQSERAARGRFVPVNCSAIPRELLESELFGHVKGSFTGAIADREGKFEAAHGGTLFLDEIGDMAPELQAKILRALQEKEIERVGGDGRPRAVDVRIIAATHRDLPTLVAEGKFREDLFYRLAVVLLKLPPLRERRDDILLLAHHFVQKHWRGAGAAPKLANEARDALLAYSWPGNVRELENAIQRALALMDDAAAIRAADLPEGIREPSTPRAWLPVYDIPDSGIVLDEVESKLIEAAMHKTNWNQTRAADLLGITRQTLIYRLQKFGIRNPAGDDKAGGAEPAETVMADDAEA